MLTLLPNEEITPLATPKPIMFEIKDKNQLYSFYMPFLKHGGIFIPNNNQKLMPPGSRALILLTLLGDPAKKTVTGKICWQTPPSASMGISQGVGVAFDDNEGNKALKVQIETILVGILGKTDVRTQTL